MPACTPLAERESWQRGWEFEEAMFLNRPLLAPASLPAPLRELRSTVLQQFCALQQQQQQPDLVAVEQQALAVDRLLLDPLVLPDHMDLRDVLHHVLTHNHELILGSLLQGEITTPSAWFAQYRRQVPEHLQHRLSSAEEIFVAVAMDGGLADERPSVVAAAVLAYLLREEEEAEDFLCGYDLFEIGAALTHVESVLDSLP